MHFTYHRRIQVPKKGRHCWPPTFSTLAPPMDVKYYCNRFIVFHCHSSRKFRIHLASIAVANSDLFCIFVPPYSMTCIRLWFLNFQKWQAHVNNMSIAYLLPLVGSKSVHKRAGHTWSKKCLQFMVFAPLIPPSTNFLKFLFLEMQIMLRRNECRLNFKNQPVKTRDLKAVLNDPPPPATNRGSQEPATNRVNPWGVIHPLRRPSTSEAPSSLWNALKALGRLLVFEAPSTLQPLKRPLSFEAPSSLWGALQPLMRHPAYDTPSSLWGAVQQVRCPPVSRLPPAFEAPSSLGGVPRPLKHPSTAEVPSGRQNRLPPALEAPSSLWGVLQPLRCPPAFDTSSSLWVPFQSLSRLLAFETLSSLWSALRPLRRFPSSEAPSSLWGALQRLRRPPVQRRPSAAEVPVVLRCPPCQKHPPDSEAPFSSWGIIHVLRRPTNFGTPSRLWGDQTLAGSPCDSEVLHVLFLIKAIEMLFQHRNMSK